MGSAPHLRLSLLLASPAILLIVADTVLLALTPFTWGVAGNAGMPGWLIPVCVLIFALPVLFIGVVTTRQIFTYTSRPFHVFKLHLPFLFIFPAAIYILFLLTAYVPDPHTYESWNNGDVHTSPESVIGMTLVLTPMLDTFLWGCAYMYAEAFSERRTPPRPADPRWFTN
jgi:hypothetical protein